MATTPITTTAKLNQQTGLVLAYLDKKGARLN